MPYREYRDFYQDRVEIHNFKSFSLTLHCQNDCFAVERLKHANEKVYPWLTVAIFFYLPMLVIVGCNIAIIRSLLSASIKRAKIRWVTFLNHTAILNTEGSLLIEIVLSNLLAKNNSSRSIQATEINIYTSVKMKQPAP